MQLHIQYWEFASLEKAQNDINNDFRQDMFNYIQYILKLHPFAASYLMMKNVTWAGFTKSYNVDNKWSRSIEEGTLIDLFQVY